MTIIVSSLTQPCLLSGARGSQGSTQWSQAKVKLCDEGWEPTVSQGQETSLWAQHPHPKPSINRGRDEDCSTDHTALQHVPKDRQRGWTQPHRTGRNSSMNICNVCVCFQSSREEGCWLREKQTGTNWASGWWMIGLITSLVFTFSHFCCGYLSWKLLVIAVWLCEDLSSSDSGYENATRTTYESVTF